MRRFPALFAVIIALSVISARTIHGQAPAASTAVARLEARVLELEKRLANVEAQLARIGKVGAAPAIVIDAFSKIPEEFGMGAGCSYAKTRNGKPIFVDNSMSGDAAMVINGKIVKLAFLEQRQSSEGVTNIYKHSDFEVSVTTRSTKTGRESTSEEGHVTVKAKDGTVVKERIYGACGA
jgi:hypothetical protein